MCPSAGSRYFFTVLVRFSAGSRSALVRFSSSDRWARLPFDPANSIDRNPQSLVAFYRTPQNLVNKYSIHISNDVPKHH